MQITGRISTGTTAVVTSKDCGVSFDVPATITLMSAAGTRKIELSVDGGLSYFTPELDHTSAQSIACTINAPVSAIKLTGVVNDAWSVL